MLMLEDSFVAQEGVMKKLVLAWLMLQAVVMMAGTKPKPNPADYPLHVQVICSFARLNAVIPVQRVGVTIDGVPYELTSNDMPFTALLAPGAYTARLLVASGAKRADYDWYRQYEFYLPNEAVRTFYLSGAGQGTCASAGQ